jgi:outer membrane protein OmpA-like peptidoglycan-associated protein
VAAKEEAMHRLVVVLAFVSFAVPAAAQVSLDSLKKEATKAAGDKAKTVAKDEANKQVVNKLNAKLLAEGKKNQCSFKKDSDEFAAGCDAKLKKLANLLIDAKKQLVAANFKGYTFVVSGHTDSTGKAEYNKELSKKRAAVIVKELVARGVPQNEIDSVGMGSERPLVTPDNTPAKQAKNRRYEIQVKI